MKTFDTIPERGDFGYQTLVGPQKVSGKAIFTLRDFFGLKITKGMPFGVVRDDAGHMYAFVRALNEPGSASNPTKFIYQSTRIDHQHIRMDKAHMASQAMTLFRARSQEGDTACWSSLPGESGNAWQLTASGERMTWKEDGLFDLSGPLIGTYMQWFLPGVDWGTFYGSQRYDLSGTCEGRPVKGVIALDQTYMAEGGAIHFKKDLVVNNKMHVVWWTFATIYKDGTWDSGSFMVGHDKLGDAIFQNETGAVRTTTDIEAQVVHKPGSYFVGTAQITLEGGEVWEYLPDPRGEMMDFVGGFPVTAQQEGRWRRVGDTRKPDRRMAWGECDRRNGTARNVHGAERVVSRHLHHLRWACPARPFRPRVGTQTRSPQKPSNDKNRRPHAS